MSKLLGLIGIPLGGGLSTRSRDDDDIVDKLSHSYTTLIFIVFAAIVSTKQYVGNPIHCWVPGHFTSNHEEYANQICWVSNFYYLPLEERIPLEGEGGRRWINYYQWVPFLLMLQAGLFFAPNLLWRLLSGKIGVDIHHVVDAGRQLHGADDRGKTLRYMVQQVDRYLGHYRDQPAGSCFSACRRLARMCPRNVCCGRKHGNFLTVTYLCLKCLYLVNVCGQLFLLDAFLGTDFHLYGFQALRSIIKDEEFPGTSRFPRVTMCDYRVRQMGNNLHRSTLQCVLPINFFNEKLFAFIWFWLLFVAVVTAISLVTWTARSLVRVDRIRWVRRHLRNMAKVNAEDRKATARFVHDYLRQDGAVLLRLVAANTSDLVASELTGQLYDHYRQAPPTYNEGEEDEAYVEGQGLA